MIEARPRSPLLAAMMLAALPALTACGNRGPAVAELPPPEVSVARPVVRPVEDMFEASGHMEAVDKVEIRARVSGYLVEVNFTDGAMVEKGQILFVIDPRPYEAAAAQASGDVGRWQAALRKAEADVARATRLLPQGAASKSELETAVAARDSATAEIRAAQAKLDAARLDLEFTRVTAPISGRISNTAVTVGNLVQAGVNSPVLSTIVATDPLYAYFDCDERMVLHQRERRLAAGQRVAPADIRSLNLPVYVGLANETGYPHKGVLDFVDNQADPTTGTIRARAVFANPDNLFQPGLFVRVRLSLGPPVPSLLVPDRAIGTDQSNKYVLVVNDQSVVEPRIVRLGQRTDDGMRAVLSGVGEHERVIVNGLLRARPGITVVAHETTMDAVAAAPEPSGGILGAAGASNGPAGTPGAGNAAATPAGAGTGSAAAQQPGTGAGSAAAPQPGAGTGNAAAQQPGTGSSPPRRGAAN
ncbi:MAG TPA: efflux RND transporter periplasmic adaptor subunit [Candidatus Limnocylindrales bacterium]|nr:efflux RND transporter periplasmic adaptor subunit [Candidatus Limnocylindrales bacterium]